MTTEGVGWASEEASDLVAPPLNLVLYMHFRVCGANTSFRYSEKLQVLAEVSFVHRSCARDKADLFYLLKGGWSPHDREIPLRIEVPRNRGRKSKRMPPASWECLTNSYLQTFVVIATGRVMRLEA